MRLTPYWEITMVMSQLTEKADQLHKDGCIGYAYSLKNIVSKLDDIRQHIGESFEKVDAEDKIKTP